ncbi:MAG: polysaccharide pyruvyl transferase family protein [Denitratisoma sp.]|nr:polysaccharide pyruvyl transferase family protein [Denitratisoma sp.]
MSPPPPADLLILFGACDRHNLGDLLFPHLAEALLAPRGVVVAGLAARDLTPFGGHRVRAIGEVLREFPDAPVIHAGGELFACDAWEAAVMLLPPEQAPGVIAQYDGRPQRFDWARRTLGLWDYAPYCLGKSQSPRDGARIFLGVGGVDLDRRDPALRGEVLGKLRAAAWVGVRDRLTLAHLSAAGIAATPMPDPAVLTAELFGARIRARAEAGEAAILRAAFPRGYLAVQFAASLGDDATLACVVGGLAREAAGRGIVFFRAGAAPWHDDLEVYRRAAARLPGARLFESLDIWDTCALIAASAGFAGSSLHGRIVAEAFGVPVLEEIVPVGQKVAAWRETWAGRDTVGAFRAAWAVMLKSVFGNT